MRRPPELGAAGGSGGGGSGGGEGDAASNPPPPDDNDPSTPTVGDAGGAEDDRAPPAPHPTQPRAPRGRALAAPSRQPGDIGAIQGRDDDDRGPPANREDGDDKADAISAADVDAMAEADVDADVDADGSGGASDDAATAAVIVAAAAAASAAAGTAPGPVTGAPVQAPQLQQQQQQQRGSMWRYFGRGNKMQRTNKFEANCNFCQAADTRLTRVRGEKRMMAAHLRNCARAPADAKEEAEQIARELKSRRSSSAFASVACASASASATQPHLLEQRHEPRHDRALRGGGRSQPHPPHLPEPHLPLELQAGQGRPPVPRQERDPQHDRDMQSALVEQARATAAELHAAQFQAAQVHAHAQAQAQAQAHADAVRAQAHVQAQAQAHAQAQAQVQAHAQAQAQARAHAAQVHAQVQAQVDAAAQARSQAQAAAAYPSLDFGGGAGAAAAGGPLGYGATSQPIQVVPHGMPHLGPAGPMPPHLSTGHLHQHTAARPWSVVRHPSPQLSPPLRHEDRDKAIIRATSDGQTARVNMSPAKRRRRTPPASTTLFGIPLSPAQPGEEGAGEAADQTGLGGGKIAAPCDNGPRSGNQAPGRERSMSGGSELSLAPQASAESLLPGGGSAAAGSSLFDAARRESSSLESTSGMLRANDGVQLYYESIGSGNPLILIHGWSGSSKVFVHNFEALAESFRVIRFDLRGHGESDKPNHGFHLSRLAMDLLNLLDHFELNRVALLGCSLGCAVIWSFVELFGSERVTAALFVDQSPWQLYAPDGSWRLGSNGLFSAASAAHLGAMLRTAPKGCHERTVSACLTRKATPAEEAFFVAESMKAHGWFLSKLMDDHNNIDWRATLPLVTCSALVIAGKASKIFPWEGVRHSANAMPNAKFVGIEEGSHWLYYEEPARFNSIVNAFLRSIHGITS